MLFNCQFAMSLPTLFLDPTLNKKTKNSEEHTEINMNNNIQNHTMPGLYNCQSIIYSC